MKKLLLALGILMVVGFGIGTAGELPGTLSYKICSLVDNVSGASNDLHLQNTLKWDYELKWAKLSISQLMELGIEDKGVYAYVTKITLSEGDFFCVAYRKHYPNKVPESFRHYVGVGWKIKIW